MANWKLQDIEKRTKSIEDLMIRYSSSKNPVSADYIKLINEKLDGKFWPPRHLTRSNDANDIKIVHTLIYKARRALSSLPSVRNDIMVELDKKRGGRVANEAGTNIMPRFINLMGDLEALEEIVNDPEKLLNEKIKTQKNPEALQAVHPGAYAYLKATKRKPENKTLSGEFQRFLEEFFDIVFEDEHDPSHAYKGWIEVGGLDWFNKLTVRKE